MVIGSGVDGRWVGAAGGSLVNGRWLSTGYGWWVGWSVELSVTAHLFSHTYLAKQSACIALYVQLIFRLTHTLPHASLLQGLKTLNQ